jgi:hypothetical protein
MNHLGVSQRDALAIKRSEEELTWDVRGAVVEFYLKYYRPTTKTGM